MSDPRYTIRPRNGRPSCPEQCLSKWEAIAEDMRSKWRASVEALAQQFGVTVTFLEDPYTFTPEGDPAKVRAFLDHWLGEKT